MQFLIKILQFWSLIQLLYLTNAGSKQTWTYEFLEIRTKSTNHDWFDLQLTLERIRRGKFGVSGFLHFKTNCYDNYTVTSTVEKSKFRSGPFVKIPMSIDNVTLTEAMNTFYKDILMTSMQNCSINAPYFADKFEAPLTARRIELDKCDISTDNLPNVLMEGYYKTRLGFYGEQSFYMEVLTLVENT